MLKLKLSSLKLINLYLYNIIHITDGKIMCVAFLFFLLALSITCELYGYMKGKIHLIVRRLN